MIVLKLKGGLGNQMFQYAAAELLGRIIDRDVIIDLDFMKSNKNGVTKRNYCLDLYRIKNKCTAELKNHYSFKLRYPFLKTMRQTIVVKEIDWQNINHYSRFKKIILDGYFLDLQPLEKYEPIVKSLFCLNEEVIYFDTDLLFAIENSQSVSIHIRRGDYLNKKNAHIYHSCDKDYYLHAIKYISSKVSNPFFYIFSDDLDWVKKELDLNVPCQFVKVKSMQPDLTEFFLMTKCKYNIIANSTYSWWAAFLNDHKAKQVVAPKSWYKNEVQNAKALEIIPSVWKLF